MTRRTVSSSSYRLPVAGFSQAVLASRGGQLLFVSGLTARAADGTIIAVGDPGGQTRTILEALTRILAEAGGGLDDLVRTVTYLVDMRHYDAVHAVRRQYFGDHPPASTTVEVSRLYDERQLVEIEATAMIDRVSIDPAGAAGG